MPPSRCHDGSSCRGLCAGVRPLSRRTPSAARRRPHLSSIDVLTADAGSCVRVLDGYPLIDLGYGTGGLSAGRMVRILLADLDSFDDLTPDQRADAVNVTHQHAVLGELRRLRELLVDMDPDLIESLTWRETEILRLLDARLSHAEIAAVLHLSPGAFQRHRNHICRKLKLRLLPFAYPRASRHPERFQQPSDSR